MSWYAHSASDKMISSKTEALHCQRCGASFAKQLHEQFVSAGRQRYTSYARRVARPAYYGRIDMRSDRTKGNRGAFEAARLKILKTQTICGICGKPVDFSYKNPHPLAPTVDHIIPVSKGGHPSDISNLQLAHRYCNRAKADSLLGPKKAEENDNVIPNDVLEQHLDWAAYRSK